MNAAPAESLTTTAANPTRWVIVGQLLDAKNRRVLSNAHLLYDQQQILHAGETPPPADLLAGRTIPDATLPDYTALPGLIEGHSHIFLDGDELNVDKRAAYQKQDAETLYQQAAQRLRALARLGIIAMRDGGDKDQVGLRLSKLTANGSGPAGAAQVFSPGAGIHRQGRYGAFFGRALENYPDIESCVQACVEEGADHIKIVPTGIINFAKGQVVAKPQFSAEEIRQFKTAARARGRQLMAHASGDLGVGHAIDGGVDTVEHGFFITADQLKNMRDYGVAWVPTFTPVQEQVDHADLMGWTGETLDNLKKILANHAHSLRQALTLGINILVGSDAGSCGVSHGLGLLREMELLENAGMPTLTILSQVTYGNRHLLPGQPPYGSVEKGFKPRLIFTRHNPLATVRNLYHEHLVLFDGKIL
ncbi:MAG: amidohydrolase family protein [Verrucomicrobiales bacterium]|jgi:imidazolonepropionase-like amidohydrolase|nr:amidohydrolase family protein [Verrucomicrobiales bacterium]